MKMMSVRVGANDMVKARAFYDATFGALGLEPAPPPPAGYQILMYSLPGGPRFNVGPARDGQPATHGNGGTILLAADSDEQVQAWYDAGMANGGVCEGKPEPKPQTGGKFGAYMRDPDGNKFGCYYGLGG